MKTKYAILGETYLSDGVWWEQVITTGSKAEINRHMKLHSIDPYYYIEYRDIRVEKYDADKPEDLAIFEGKWPDDEAEADALYEKMNS